MGKTGGGTTKTTKTRVGVRLKEAVGKNSLNRSSDLDQLVQQFNALQEKQKSLIVALKTHHASICTMAKSRLQVADSLATITKNSEIYDCAGQMPTETLAKSDVCSYASIHHGLASRTKMYADKYGQFVVSYAIEWDKVVTQRVMQGLKEAENLHRDLDHYQKKTEALRAAVNGTLAKGKQVDKKTEEKLGRNEEKLKNARLEYNKVATSMCVLIEEVTDRAWKDIHPMLLKIAQFDYTLSSDETKALAELTAVQDKLKRLADQHQLKPENRLKDIQTLQPSLLSTKKEESGQGLAIESGSASGSFGGTPSSSLDMAMPPGTVGAQGLGGFPVPIPSSYSGVSRASSVTSMSSYASGNANAAAPNTMEMLAIAAAAAPPPTMDQVNDATNALSISSSSPTTNGYSTYTTTTAASPSRTMDSYPRSNSLPPDVYSGSGSPAAAAAAYGRSGSLASYGNDGDSIASFGSSVPVPAPAPSAPPPPPPAAAPPLPPTTPGGAYGTATSMYGASASPVSAPLPPSYGMQQQQQPSMTTNPFSGGLVPSQSPSSPSGQYGMPPPPSPSGNPYGMQPPPQQSPANQFGGQPSPSNQFGGQPSPSNQFGQPSPLNYQYGNH